MQDAAYDTVIKVKTYPGASAECGGGGLVAAARPLRATGAGAPVLEAIQLPV
jgi:hypothetical protein